MPARCRHALTAATLLLPAASPVQHAIAGRQGTAAFRFAPGRCLHSQNGRKDITMHETTSPALTVALAYHQAWTSHDMDKAMSYVADDIVCDAPAGRLEGAAAY